MLIIGKLTALKVAREKRPGMHSDGGGFYLRSIRGYRPNLSCELQRRIVSGVLNAPSFEARDRRL